MPGWTSWIGWTVGYAVAIWGIDTTFALLEPWLKNASQRRQDVAEAYRTLIPLLLAFLIGFWLRAWWWVTSPLVAIFLLMFTFPLVSYLKRSQAERQQAYAGLIFGLGVTTYTAGTAAFAAFIGVVIGRLWPGG